MMVRMGNYQSRTCICICVFMRPGFASVVLVYKAVLVVAVSLEEELLYKSLWLTEYQLIPLLLNVIVLLVCIFYLFTHLVKEICNVGILKFHYKPIDTNEVAFFW